MPGIIVNDFYQEYECGHCDRTFNSSKALFEHCEKTSRHSWCSECHLTFDNHDELRDHEFWAEAHCTCGVCDEVFENANNLKCHMIVHKEPEHECVSCYRMFRSGSSMLIHLETGCHNSHWNTRMTQKALMIFTKFNPTYYGIDSNSKGPITCGCQGKSFTKVSALCQHLESETCDISYWGSDVVADLVDMMRKGEWQQSRRGGHLILNFDDVVEDWGNYIYR